MALAAEEPVVRGLMRFCFFFLWERGLASSGELPSLAAAAAVGAAPSASASVSRGSRSGLREPMLSLRHER